MKTYGNIRHRLLLALAPGAPAASCGRASDDPTPPQQEGVEVGFRISLDDPAGTRAASQSRAGYDNGTSVDFENYIDLANKNYRILFFDMQEHYLTTFVPEKLVPVDADPFRSKTYEVLGKIERPLPSSFKVVMLANWDAYPGPLIYGQTSIADIRTAETGRYVYTVPFRLSEQRLIPMYGVKTCEHRIFTPGMRTDRGTIHLLRAMAKVEVVCTTEAWTLDEVTLHRYNGTGYCAPKDTYRSPEGDPELYYTDEVHLVGDANDAEVKSLSLEQPQPGRFVAYIPEYRNLAAGSGNRKAADAAELRVRFKERSDKEYTIEFKYYNNPPAENKVDDPFDIRRNSYYKFTITKAEEQKLVVDVAWYESRPLDPGFGLLPE